MTKPDWEDLLNEYRRTETPPPLPGSFSADVLREIRLRSSSSEESRLAVWFHSLLRPGWMAATLGLALVFGAALPAIERAPDPAQQVAESLGLEIFSHSSATMPSGLLK